VAGVVHGTDLRARAAAHTGVRGGGDAAGTAPERRRHVAQVELDGVDVLGVVLVLQAGGQGDRRAGEGTAVDGLRQRAGGGRVEREAVGLERRRARVAGQRAVHRGAAARGQRDGQGAGRGGVRVPVGHLDRGRLEQRTGRDGGGR